jgi:hypothetical protein
MHRMSITESIYTYITPCIADVLTGFGLSTLLEFSRTSPEMQNLTSICVGVILAVGVVVAFKPFHPPAWVSLVNSTFSLVITLSLVLNLFSQLCPPNGKELSLIPTYVLMCVPRTSPTGNALVLQCGITLLIVCIFLVLPTSKNVRPDGDVGFGASIALSVAAGTLLQTFSSHQDEYFVFQRDRWWDVAGVVSKGIILVILGSVGNTSLYHFMYDRPNTVPMELFIAYGILILFACMQSAAVWFGNLKKVMSGHAQWRLVVRIQHIINALIVAAAWVYPLQLHGLRVFLLVLMLIFNTFHAFFFK